MNWDELDDKFNRIDEATKANVRPAIVAEFGGLTELAFGILESFLDDRVKYSDISFNCTGEKQYAHDITNACYLGRKLEEFKNEFNRKG